MFLVDMIYGRLQDLSQTVWNRLNLFHTESLELGISILAFALGTFLLLPFQTFSALLRVYYFFLVILPEEGWGLPYCSRRVEFVCPLFRALEIEAGGWVGNPLWTFVALSFVVAFPNSTATPIYVTLAILSAWSYLRMEKQ